MMETEAEARQGVVNEAELLDRAPQGVIGLAMRYAREDGISLKLGQSVPMGWLTANHETGRSDVAATAHSEAAVTS